MLLDRVCLNGLQFAGGDTTAGNRSARTWHGRWTGYRRAAEHAEQHAGDERTGCKPSDPRRTVGLWAESAFGLAD